MESYGDKLKDAFDNVVQAIISFTLYEKYVAFFVDVYSQLFILFD